MTTSHFAVIRRDHIHLHPKGMQSHVLPKVQGQKIYREQMGYVDMVEFTRLQDSGAGGKSQAQPQPR